MNEKRGQRRKRREEERRKREMKRANRGRARNMTACAVVLEGGCAPVGTGINNFDGFIEGTGTHAHTHIQIRREEMVADGMKKIEKKGREKRRKRTNARERCDATRESDATRRAARIAERNGSERSGEHNTNASCAAQRIASIDGFISGRNVRLWPVLATRRERRGGRPAGW